MFPLPLTCGGRVSRDGLAEAYLAHEVRDPRLSRLTFGIERHRSQSRLTAYGTRESPEHRNAVDVVVGVLFQNRRAERCLDQSVHVADCGVQWRAWKLRRGVRRGGRDVDAILRDDQEGRGDQHRYGETEDRLCARHDMLPCFGCSCRASYPHVAVHSVVY